MDGFAEFEFDLPKALRDALIQLLDGMNAGMLDIKRTNDVPDEQGVYQLFYDGVLLFLSR